MALSATLLSLNISQDGRWIMEFLACTCLLSKLVDFAPDLYVNGGGLATLVTAIGWRLILI